MIQLQLIQLTTNYQQYKRIEELIALDHSYASPSFKAPLEQPPSWSPSESMQQVSSSTDSLCTNSISGDSPTTDFDIKTPTNSSLPPLPVSQVQKNPPKPRQSAIKYILGDAKKKDKPVRARKEKGKGKSAPPVAASTTSKLESLLKAPSRKNCGSTSPTSTLASVFDNSETSSSSEIEIDVMMPSPVQKIKYDEVKARNLMNECEKFVNIARPTDVPEDWESLIVKTGWTKIQKSLFDETLKILHKDHLSRMSYTGNLSEPVLRRLSIDATAQRMRNALTKVAWDCKLTQWLHGILKDNLSWEYLASYIDVLQTLRSKVPTLVDRMILLSITSSHPTNVSIPTTSATSSTSTASIQQIVNPIITHQTAEALNLLLKRQWDPFAAPVKQSKGKKLKYDPMFLLIPPFSASWGNPISNRRNKSFISLLASIGKTVVVSVSLSATFNASVDEYTEKTIQASRSKLYETKATFPTRPLFLIGWGPGAVIAATLSLTEKVAGVICLGFPLFTLQGTRGDTHRDALLHLKVPVLFVVGDKSRNMNVLEMDRFRKKLKCPSSLVVIKDGDEYLMVKRSQKRLLLVTQSCIDKNVVDEISLFIGNYCNESILASLMTPASHSSKISSSTKLPTLPATHSLSPKKINSASTSKSAISILNSGSHNKINTEDAMDQGNAFESEQIFDVYDFDEAKKIPSNTSSNRRKAYYRASSTSVAPPATPCSVYNASIPPPNMTASQLVQQDTYVRGKPKSSGPIASQPVTIPGLSKGLPITIPRLSVSGNSDLSNDSQEADSVKTVKVTNINIQSYPPPLISTSTMSTTPTRFTNSNSNGLNDHFQETNLIKAVTVNDGSIQSPNLPHLISTMTTTTTISRDNFGDSSSNELLASDLINKSAEVDNILPSSPPPLISTTAKTPTLLGDNTCGPPSNNLQELDSHKSVNMSSSSHLISTLTTITSTRGCNSNSLSSSLPESDLSKDGKVSNENIQSTSPPHLISTITTTTTRGGSNSCGDNSNSNLDAPTQVVRVINATEIEHLNNVLLSKGSTLSKILASGKSIVLQKTLVKKASSTTNSNCNGPVQQLESPQSTTNSKDVVSQPVPQNDNQSKTCNVVSVSGVQVTVPETNKKTQSMKSYLDRADSKSSSSVTSETPKKTTRVNPKGYSFTSDGKLTTTPVDLQNKSMNSESKPAPLIMSPSLITKANGNLTSNCPNKKNLHDVKLVSCENSNDKSSARVESSISQTSGIITTAKRKPYSKEKAEESAPIAKRTRMSDRHPPTNHHSSQNKSNDVDNESEKDKSSVNSSAKNCNSTAPIAKRTRMSDKHQTTNHHSSQSNCNDDAIDSEKDKSCVNSSNNCNSSSSKSTFVVSIKSA